MIDTSTLPSFLAATSLLFLTLGPNTVLTLSTALTEGRRSALYGAAGIGSATICHALAAGAGLAVLLAASPVLFDLFRYAGAAYLVWLCYKRLTAPRMQRAAGPAAVSPWFSFRRGFITNLLNPKVVAFIAVFVSQWVSPAAGPVAAQFAIYGTIIAVMGLLFDGVLAFCAGSVGRALLEKPLFQRLANALMASVYLGLAVRMLVMRRPV